MHPLWLTQGGRGKSSDGVIILRCPCCLLKAINCEDNVHIWVTAAHYILLLICYSCFKIHMINLEVTVMQTMSLCKWFLNHIHPRTGHTGAERSSLRSGPPGYLHKSFFSDFSLASALQNTLASCLVLMALKFALFVFSFFLMSSARFPAAATEQRLAPATRLNLAITLLIYSSALLLKRECCQESCAYPNNS